jgi:hypothetical protein
MEPLRREVMAPRHPVGLLGPLFVLGSTLALTMAMAAMALAPHPRHHHRTRPVMRAPASAPAVHPIPLTDDQRRCGAPVYRARADGMVDATYEVCTDLRVHQR